MTFETDLEGFRVRVSVSHSESWYSVGIVGTVPPQLSKSFDTLDAARDAIKKYSLSLRKDFVNKEAWLKGGQKVEVTSVCADEPCYWIRHFDGRREKALMSALFSDGDVVQLAIGAEQALKQEISDKWDSVPKWAPKFERT